MRHVRRILLPWAGGTSLWLGGGDNAMADATFLTWARSIIHGRDTVLGAWFSQMAASGLLANFFPARTRWASEGGTAGGRGLPEPRTGAAVVRGALDEVGLSAVPVTVRVVTSQAEAEQLGFLGSPSVLINGRDPFAEPHHRPAMACRLYRDDTTGVSGVPPIRRLRHALKQTAGIAAH